MPLLEPEHVAVPNGPEPEGRGHRRIAVVVVAKSAFAAAPLREMEQLTRAVSERRDVSLARFAFTEQGLPPLREVLRDVVPAGVDEIVLVPVLIPMEPGFRASLTKCLDRWRRADDRAWPTIRIGPGSDGCDAVAPLVGELVDKAMGAEALSASPSDAVAGSLVPAQKRRVLVCQGGPCNNAGAGLIWGHLRNEQEWLGLRKLGEGAMSARTSCLGPCGLAPVVQVWPEGTVYGGVDEARIDRIIASHLIAGIPCPELAYPADGTKQRLRAGGR